MDNPHPLNQSRLPDSVDEFVAGQDNQLRRYVSRLVHGLLRPPYFPGTLIWFLLAIITSQAAIELLSQPDGYWADPSISTSQTFLLSPFSWGAWTLGIYGGYLLLIGIFLTILHEKPAFVLWMGLGIFHLSNLPGSFHCGANDYFAFMYPGNCAGVYVAFSFLAGLLFALGLLAAIQFNFIPWLSADDHKPDWLHRLGVLSVGWIGIMMILVAYGAIHPNNIWQLVEPTHVPPARTSMSMAYDTHRSVAVLFGGTTHWTQDTGWNSINDTWEWDGADWVEAQPEHSPAARYGAAAAFDEKRGVTVLFGGSAQDGVFYGDTWEWNGEDWLQITPTQSPPARQFPLMYYDALRGTVLLYGGAYFDNKTQSNAFLDDIWEWDGVVWKQIAFEQSRRTSSGAVIFDPIRQSPLMMDGEGLWAWQDTLWLPIDFPRKPVNRWASQLALSPQGQEIILFGGFKGEQVFADTWVYDGQDWDELISATHPPARSGHIMFFDQTRGTIILFGGLNGGTFYQDMWELIRQ